VFPRSAVSRLSHLVLRRIADAHANDLPALMIMAEKAVQSLYAGEHSQRRAGNGEQFWQFRDYDSADRPQDIDWKQSAKGDRVFIRQKQHQTAQNVLFWLQQDRGMTIKSPRLAHNKAETAFIIALGLAMMVARGGDRIGALENPVRTGRSDKNLLHLGEVLFRHPKILPDGPVMPVSAALPRQASLCLCGDFMAPVESIDMALSALAARSDQGLIIQVLDPMEIDLPFNGRTIFKSMDGNTEIPIANVPSIRAAYGIRLRDHIKNVEAISRRHGFHHILHNTRTPVRETLQRAWITMERMRG